jgi:hypothetical protein
VNRKQPLPALGADQLRLTSSAALGPQHTAAPQLARAAVPLNGGLRTRESITSSSLAGPEMTAVTVLSWMLILTTPDRGDAPAYHRSQWTTSSKGRRSGRRRGRSQRSAG